MSKLAVPLRIYIIMLGKGLASSDLVVRKFAMARFWYAKLAQLRLLSRNFTIHAAKDGVVTFVKTKKCHFSGKSVPRVRVEVR